MIFSQRRPVCHQNNQEHTLHSKRCNATDKRCNSYTVSIGLSVASVKWWQSSFKKFVALVPMGPNDSKAKGTKWCFVKSSTYLASFLVVTSTTATAAVNDVDAKYESESVSMTVTFHTAYLPACHSTLVRPSGRLPSVWSHLAGSLDDGSPVYNTAW